MLSQPSFKSKDIYVERSSVMSVYADVMMKAKNDSLSSPQTTARVSRTSASDGIRHIKFIKYKCKTPEEIVHLLQSSVSKYKSSISFQDGLFIKNILIYLNNWSNTWKRNLMVFIRQGDSRNMYFSQELNQLFLYLISSSIIRMLRH